MAQLNAPKITPFLWFDGQTEEAINFYTSVFKNSSITSIRKFPEGVPGMGGKVMTGEFELEGQKFMALDGGPMFQFTEAISMFISCTDQEEVDYFWNKLTEGGEESRCGWLKDKFGLSWQVVPAMLGSVLGGADPEGAGRAMQAMMQMGKLDIQQLQDAYDGK